MPKRARVDEADGAPEALARATKAAINKHGWDELRLAYRTGRLRFMEGVGAKATAEITLFLQASAAERSHWQRFMDLVGPHLNSDWMKRLASWSNSGIVNDSKRVREYEETGQEPSWPIFAIDEARARPYEHLCNGVFP